MGTKIERTNSKEEGRNLLLGAVIIGTGAFINELGNRYYAPHHTMSVSTTPAVSKPWTLAGEFGNALGGGLIPGVPCMSSAALPPRPTDQAAPVVTEIRLPRFHDALGDMGTGSSRRIK